MKYKMILSYDGTCYGGWQVQPNQKTIQEVVQEALHVLLKTDCPIVGSGRTDAGVHALEQVAHFSYDLPFDPGERPRDTCLNFSFSPCLDGGNDPYFIKVCGHFPHQSLKKNRKSLQAPLGRSPGFDISPFQYALNALLPPDIRIQEITPATNDFHARFSVKKKIYHYHLHLSPQQSPFNYRYRLPVYAPLNLDLLQEALPHLIGTHDFTAFAGTGCGSKDPVKTLYRLEMAHEEGGIRLEFEGNGFLYKMVRNIVGTLLEIAAEKRSPSDLPKVLKSKDRTQAGQTAPSQGLFLVKVNY